jgi:hypothetical protein
MASKNRQNMTILPDVPLPAAQQRHQADLASGISLARRKSG